MKKSLSFLLIGLCTVTLSACSNEEPTEDPQTVVNLAWQKLAEENADYSMGTVTLEGDASITFGPDSGTIEGTAVVMFDTTDEDNPRTAMKLDLDGEGSFQGQSGSAGLIGEIRTLEETTYLFLEDLTLSTGSAETDLMANFAKNFFQNQWISLPSELGVEETGELLPTDNIDTEKIAEISKEHNFFVVKEYLGDQKYDLEIDVDKLKAYLTALNEELEGDMNPADLEGLDMLFSQIDYSFQVQINEEYDVSWVMGSFTAQDPESSGEATLSFEANLSEEETTGEMMLEVTGDQPGSLSSTFTIKHDEGSVSIQAPDDAQEFDPNALFGLGAGAGAGLPGAGVPGL